VQHTAVELQSLVLLPEEPTLREVRKVVLKLRSDLDKVMESIAEVTPLINKPTVSQVSILLSIREITLVLI